MPTPPTGTVTFLFTDVEASTRPTDLAGEAPTPSAGAAPPAPATRLRRPAAQLRLLPVPPPELTFVRPLRFPPSSRRLARQEVNRACPPTRTGRHRNCKRHPVPTSRPAPAHPAAPTSAKPLRPPRSRHPTRPTRRAESSANSRPSTRRGDVAWLFPRPGRARFRPNATRWHPNASEWGRGPR
jgi:hypothetical protein